MKKLSDRIGESIKSALGVCLVAGFLVAVSPFGLFADSKEESEKSSPAKKEKTEDSAKKDKSDGSKKETEKPKKDWHKVASKQGKCTMDFPATAEHVSETMKIDDETELKYDAYISASDAETVFMLLVAQYPEFVDEEFAQMSLEAFLNGILTHGSGAQLLFADLVLVDGHEGMDFFIRTGANYFKGRAVMVKNQLYLMAMECKVSDYDEKFYEKFVDSFLLDK
jgi:hypothetical protein